jgi:hypothetical protein
MTEDCREIRNLLPDFLSHRTSGEEQRAVQDHLERCVSCSEEALALKETFLALEGAKPSIPSETYWTNFLPRLHNRLSEERRTGRELAPWVHKFLVPSAALIVTILLVSRIGIIPESKDSFSEVRQVVEQMSASEFHRLAETSSDLLVPESSSRLEAMLPHDEDTRRAINSLIAASSDEFIQLREVNLHGLVDSGLEDLTDEEMETVIERLGGNGTL